MRGSGASWVKGWRASSLDLNNAKKSRREFMLRLPGVDVHAPDVRIPVNGNAYEQAVASIEAVEKWADAG
jgi:hypothetical protein